MILIEAVKCTVLPLRGAYTLLRPAGHVIAVQTCSGCASEQLHAEIASRPALNGHDDTC